MPADRCSHLWVLLAPPRVFEMVRVSPRPVPDTMPCYFHSLFLWSFFFFSWFFASVSRREALAPFFCFPFFSAVVYIISWSGSGPFSVLGSFGPFPFPPRGVSSCVQLAFPIPPHHFRRFFFLLPLFPRSFYFFVRPGSSGRFRNSPNPTCFSQVCCPSYPFPMIFPFFKPA